MIVSGSGWSSPMMPLLLPHLVVNPSREQVCPCRDRLTDSTDHCRLLVMEHDMRVGGLFKAHVRRKSSLRALFAAACMAANKLVKC